VTRYNNTLRGARLSCIIRSRLATLDKLLNQSRAFRADLFCLDPFTHLDVIFTVKSIRRKWFRPPFCVNP